MSPNNDSSPLPIRLIIIGLTRKRVQRIASILTTTSSPLPTEIEYLPCVATFASYKDENGVTKRYLSRVDYCGDGDRDQNSATTTTTETSLVSFFDDEKGGVAGVAVGCGIYSAEDVTSVKSFIDSLSCGYEKDVNLYCVQAGEGYGSMEEEDKAYKNLSDEDKERVLTEESLGPGKMAKFVRGVAEELLREVLREEQEPISDNNDNATTKDDTISSPTIPQPVNQDEERYACRMCRSVLFTQSHLENPPHTPSRHSFHPKKNSAGNDSSSCQTLFLSNTLPWMMTDGNEGKISCPKCDVKIGSWNWSGAQCSCGTWVTPAISFPKSKLDVIRVGAGVVVIEPMRPQVAAVEVN